VVSECHQLFARIDAVVSARALEAVADLTGAPVGDGVRCLSRAFGRLRFVLTKVSGAGLGRATWPCPGSVARGEAGSGSDVDVLVELDHDRPMGVFETVDAFLLSVTNPALQADGLTC